MGTRKSYYYASAAVIAIACLNPNVARSGGCRHLFVHHAPAIVAPVYQPYVFSVGDDVRLNALAQKIVDRAAPQIAAAVAQQLRAPEQGGSLALTKDGLPPNLAANCLSCHNGTKAFELSKGVTAEQITHWVELASDNLDDVPDMRTVLARMKASGKIADLTQELLKGVPRIKAIVNIAPPPPLPPGLPDNGEAPEAIGAPLLPPLPEGKLE